MVGRRSWQGFGDDAFADVTKQVSNMDLKGQPLEVLDQGGLTLHPVGEMSTDGLQLLLYSVVELQGFKG